MVKPVALPDTIKSTQPPTTSRRQCSLPRPLHVAALALAVAAMLLSVRLAAEQWDIAGLPLFGPRRLAPSTWLPQPVPEAIPVALPEQVVQPGVDQPEVLEAVQPAVMVEPVRTDTSAAVVADAAAAITEANSAAVAAQPGVTSTGLNADTVAPGATATAGTDGTAASAAAEGADVGSVSIPCGVSVSFRGLRDVSGAQPAPVRPQVRDPSGETATPSVTAETDTPNTAQVSTGTVWGANPYGP